MARGGNLVDQPPLGIGRAANMGRPKLQVIAVIGINAPHRLESRRRPT